MSLAQQVEHFKRYEEGRLKVVLRFLAGLNKLNCFSIEEIANNFFQTPLTCQGSVYLLSCDAAVGIDLVQWLFEAQSDDVIEHVLGQKTIEFHLSLGMLPLDYYSLGYCISHSKCQWVLGLGEEEIGETEVKMLAAGAGTRSEPRGRVVGLREGFSFSTHFALTSCLNRCFKIFSISDSCLYNKTLSCDSISWPDLSALRVLQLTISSLTGCKLNNVLPHLSLEALTITVFSNESDLVYEHCVVIGDYITSTTSLKELCISLFFVDVSGAKVVETITAALASNHSLPLERLELECVCTFTATAGDSLAQFITHTTTLKYLSMENCTVSAHVLLVLARAIHHNSILQTKNMEEFSLTVNGDNEAKDLSQLLVEYPDLINSAVNDDDLHCSGISDAGAVALAQALHHNSTLTVLDLSNNSIGDAGEVALAQALHRNSTLTRLDLSNNSIGDAGAVA